MIIVTKLVVAGKAIPRGVTSPGSGQKERGAPEPLRKGGSITSCSFYLDELSPKIVRITNRFDPAIEPRIKALEQAFLTYFRKEGISSLPPFALRGISCSAVEEGSRKAGSLEDWRKNGYLSKDGGNFFVFAPDRAPEKGDEFLCKLMASSGSAFRYGGRAFYPVVLLIKMDRSFMIPASGGNDGISGSFPLTMNLDGRDYHLTNLDVGCITRPHAQHKVGLVAEKVPEEKVAMRIGEKGLPSWASRAEKVYERPEDELVALTRWTYLQVLEDLAKRVGLRKG